ncbi:MAG: hypothetical protein JJT78_02285 [Leptospira sp.]|nr:hypothetical protein [Leptospira sp.]
MNSRFSFYFLLFVLFSTYLLAEEKATTQILSSPLPDPKNPLYLEQISCKPENCTTLEVETQEENEKAQDTAIELLRKKAAKVVIDFKGDRSGIGSDENKVWKEYVREIAKRDGTVVFEPFYLGQRGMQLTDIPVFGDYFRVGWNVYTRIRSVVLYSAMKHYNAKVLYHPQTQEIMMIYFVHRDFGSICETVFSQCNIIEYLDDDIFDMQLQQALDKYPVEEILIRFNKTEAMLPLSSIQMEAILNMNRSSRLYKWLIAAKEVEKKPEVQGRYITAQTALMIVDYSMAAYDLVQAMRMYAKARSWKAVAYYSPTEYGDSFRSIQFSKINKNSSD